MKRKIKTTHIDTGSHIYCGVSKKDLIKINYPIRNISEYSGMDLKKIYLEEDIDGSNFIKICENYNIKIEKKNTYLPKFNIHHNFNPKLVNYNFEINSKIKLCDDNIYTVVSNNPIIVENELLCRFKLTKSNPYKFIKEIIN